MVKMNQKIRNDIAKWVKNPTMPLFIPFDLNTISKEDKIKWILVEETIFMDGYKRNCFKRNTATLTDEDRANALILEQIIDFSQIHDYIKKNPDFFSYLLESSYYFREASSLEKILQIKMMKEEEVEFLLEITPQFSEDIETYDIKITPDFCLQYFHKQENYTKQSHIPFQKENILKELAGFIKIISLKEDLTDFLKELIQTDIDYHENHLGISTANGRYKAKQRKNRADKKVAENMQYMIKDEYYLMELLDTYIASKTKEKVKEK